MTGKRLIEILNPQAGERILDAGCGMGDLTAEIAARGALVTGIDILPALLEQARFRYPRITFVEADLLQYDAAEPFDGVFAHATLHWVQPPEEAARKLAGLLRRGGRLAATLGGAAPALTDMMNYYLPAAAEYERLLAEAGFGGIRITEESDLLIVQAYR